MTLRGRLFTGSVWVLTSQIVVQAMSVLVTIILARYLGNTADESAHLLGKYFIFTSLATVLAQLAALGLHVALPKLVAEFRVLRPERTGRVASTGLGITLLSSIILAVAYFLVADYVALHIYGDEALAALLRLSAPAVVFTAVSIFALSLLQGLHRLREYSLVAMAFSVLSVPITWILVLNPEVFLLPSSLVGAGVAAVLNLALHTVGVLYVARRAARLDSVPLHLSVDRAQARTLLGLSTPAFFSVLLLRMAVLYQTSVIFLVLGDLLTGVWKITGAFYRLILYIPAALAIPLLPAMSELYVTERPGERRVKVTRILRTTMVIVLPACLVAGLGAQYLIDFLFGRTYLTNGSLYATFILSVAAFFDAVSLVVISLLQGTGRTKRALAFDTLQAAVIFSLTFVLFSQIFLSLSPETGLLAAAGVTLLNAGVLFVAALAYLARRAEVDLRALGDLLGLAITAFGVAGIVVLLLGNPVYLPLAALTLAAVFYVGFRLLDATDREILRDSVLFFRPRRLRNPPGQSDGEAPANPGHR